MSNTDPTMASYDALNALHRDITALLYLASVIPSEDEHQALISVIADRLKSDFDIAYAASVALWSPPSLSVVSG